MPRDFNRSAKNRRMRLHLMHVSRTNEVIKEWPQSKRIQPVFIQFATFVIQRSQLIAAGSAKLPENIEVLRMKNLTLSAHLWPQFAEGKIRVLIQNSQIEEVLSRRKTTLPKVVRLFMTRFVIRQVHTYPRQNLCTFALIPPVREQHSAYIPEDRLNLELRGRSHSPSGKSAPALTCSHAAISFCQLSSLPRNR